MGERLREAKSHLAWRIGDWLIIGQDRGYIPREKYAEAAHIVGLPRKRLRQLAWVARSVESSSRRDDLSFAHHVVVASLLPEQQSPWLAKAAAQKWTREQLREEIAGVRALPAPMQEEDEARKTEDDDEADDAENEEAAEDDEDADEDDEPERLAQERIARDVGRLCRAQDGIEKVLHKWSPHRHIENAVREQFRGLRLTIPALHIDRIERAAKWLLELVDAVRSGESPGAGTSAAAREGDASADDDVVPPPVT
jgi:hypothetical protein